MIVFTCRQCGEVHVGLPAIAYRRPVPYLLLSKRQRRAATANDDFCIIDDEHFFVRAVLETPIAGVAKPLQWGVWVALGWSDFERYMDAFDDSDQSKLGPMFSLLASALDGYPDTLVLRCQLLPQDNRQRPLIELKTDQDHPLVRDQLNGISVDRAIELAMPVLPCATSLSADLNF